MNITLSFNQVGFYMLIEPINTNEDLLKTFFITLTLLVLSSIPMNNGGVKFHHCSHGDSVVAFD